MSTNTGSQGMSLIVKTVTRLTVGLVFLYGVYIVLNGHLSPGGGFSGGVIIGLAFINMVLAYGRDAASRIATASGASILESMGAIMYVSIALLGLSWGGFFKNFLPHGTPFRLLSAGTLPLINIAICLKVGAGMFSIFLALIVLLRFEPEGKK
jgi:multisubunit Na+/H+ antiporter MnhB subunit